MAPTTAQLRAPPTPTCPRSAPATPSARPPSPRTCASPASTAPSPSPPTLTCTRSSARSRRGRTGWGLVAAACLLHAATWPCTRTLTRPHSAPSPACPQTVHDLHANAEQFDRKTELRCGQRLAAAGAALVCGMQHLRRQRSCAAHHAPVSSLSQLQVPAGVHRHDQQVRQGSTQRRMASVSRLHARRSSWEPSIEPLACRPLLLTALRMAATTWPMLLVPSLVCGRGRGGTFGRRTGAAPACLRPVVAPPTAVPLPSLA